MTAATLPSPSTFAFRWGAWPLWAASWKMSVRRKLLAISICDGIFWSQTLGQPLRVVPSCCACVSVSVYLRVCVFVDSHLNAAWLIWWRFDSALRSCSLSSTGWYFFLLLPLSLITLQVYVSTLLLAPTSLFILHLQFCVDPCLTVSVCYYINSICAQCMPRRLKVQTLAQSIFQIDKINSR